jgi:uncharacterized protein YbjT (DUF2867 family)
MELVSKNSQRIVLVTGATGGQGSAVYQHLQKKGFKLRALVRDLNSDQTRHPDSLMRAMDEVYGVFSVQPYK